MFTASAPVGPQGHSIFEGDPLELPRNTLGTSCCEVSCGIDGTRPCHLQGMCLQLQVCRKSDLPLKLFQFIVSKDFCEFYLLEAEIDVLDVY